jgi:predicted O-methyltransferase YrrM
MDSRPYNSLGLLVRYLSYILTAGNGKGHGIHSPFVYAFIRDLLNDKRKYYAFDRVESLRQTLLHDHTAIPVTDLGAGSGRDNGSSRKLSHIAAHAAKGAKLGQLLFRTVNYFHPAVIIELGTSLGISTSYLASANSGAKVYSIEGSPAIAAQAAKNFATLGLQNIETLAADFDSALPRLLNTLPGFDLAYVDGNHRYEPTIRYFNQLVTKTHADSVIILDDIHWSGEMEKAWEEIKNHPSVTCTIDLFFLGYVFFRPEFKVRQHFTIRY